MRFITIVFIFLFHLPIIINAQTVEDDFEGSGTVTWEADLTQIIVFDVSFPNQFQQGINTSSTVLKYDDNGSTSYANIRFNTPGNFDLSTNNTFSLKIYIPADGISGNQSNQISLKLQDGNLGEPWVTQSEIIKTIVLNQWQEVIFNFSSDAYLPASPDPITRTDFNRVVLQVNGENNNDSVIAYIDDFLYDGTINIPEEPVFDNLVWFDEFDTNGAPDSTKWGYDIGGNGWGNGESQYYTSRSDNVIVEDGLLKITAKRENYQGSEFTSARMLTLGKYDFTYGRVEISANLPTGGGTWPALWMLGSNITSVGWPACGEADIMEHVGNNQGTVSSAMHTPSSFGNTVNHGDQYLADVSTAFHLYALEWSEEKMVFSVDGVEHYTYNPSIKNSSTWPFDENMFFIFNVAMGGSFGGNIDPSFTESIMEVDYIRVYEASTLSVSYIELENTLKFFPNPVDDTLNIELKMITNQNVDMQVVDISGRVIYNKQCFIEDYKISYDASALNSGLYFIRLTDRKGLETAFKFVKK